MKSIGQIDSIILRKDSFESLFEDKRNYNIQTVKSVGIFEPKEWIKAFKKKLNQSILEAKILHTSTGLTLPLKRYNRTPIKQSLDIGGLYGYDEKSDLLNGFFNDNILELMECEVRRIDICFDFIRIPNRIIKKLSEKRKAFKFKNTTYYKTLKEKKTNDTMDIKTYNKQRESKLFEPLERLEFCFKGSYFEQGTKLKNLDKKLLQKMEKSILKFSSIKAKIPL